MLSLFVPCPSRLGFNPYFQEIKQKHIDTEFTDLKPKILSRTIPSSISTALTLSVLPCIATRFLVCIPRAHLAIIAGTLFTLTLLTTPISSCYSPTLYKITNFTNGLACLAIIITHIFYTYMAPSPLNIASLLLMVAAPIVDSYADIACSQRHKQLHTLEQQRLFRCILWQTQKEDPARFMPVIARRRVTDCILMLRFRLRLCLTTAWCCLYAFAPIATNPLQRAFAAVLLIRNIAMLLASKTLGL